MQTLNKAGASVHRSQQNWQTIIGVALVLVLGLSAWLVSAPAYSDTASSMHDALKERWYTTEVVVFRNTKPPADESLLIAGERMSVAEQRALNTTAATAEDLSIEREPGPELAPEIEDAIELKQLVTGSESGELQRPELDAEPWEDIKDYDAADDLGELVARNMATWETQLRAQDGRWLSESELTLEEAIQKLQRSRNIEVLLHGGWTQAVPARGQGKPVSLSMNTELQANLGAGDTYLNPVSGEQQARLAGEITVTLGRYLHVKPTLFFTPELETSLEPIPNANPDNPQSLPGSYDRPSTGPSNGRAPTVRDLSSPTTQPRRSALDRLRDRETMDRLADKDHSAPRLNGQERDFEQELPPYLRLDQSRRVRSGELHYIDHPELGMLVRVTPVVATEQLQEQFALLQ